MPRERQCDYCGTDIEPGTGTMFVHTDGTTVHFCSSKCENNADLGRDARNLEWTAAGQEAAEARSRSEERAAAADAEAAASDEADTASDAEDAEDETEDGEEIDEEAQV